MDTPEIRVTIRQRAVKLQYEAGSLDEALAAHIQMAPKLKEFFNVDIGQEGQGASEAGAAPPAATTSSPPVAEKPKRGRKGADPASASAPPPLPVPAPGNEPEPTPAFLQRTAAPPAPPVPPLPNAPPVAPAPPNPTNPLAIKVKAEVERRGEPMLPWLTQSGFVVAGATFPEALEVVQYLAPDKLESIAKALGVSA